MILLCAYRKETIGNTQIRVLADSEYCHHLIARSMHIKVISVVEVTVTSSRISNVFCCLMNREIIPGRNRHCGSMIDLCVRNDGIWIRKNDEIKEIKVIIKVVIRNRPSKHLLLKLILELRTECLQKLST